MKSIWITDIKEYIKIRDQWDLALKESEADRPYLLSDLIITWWEVFYEKKKLKIFVVYDEHNKIVAGFPLYIGRTKLKKGAFRRISQIGDSFANLTEPFYCITVEEFQNIFFDELNKLKGWDFAEFQQFKIDFIGIENGGEKIIKNKLLLDYDTNPIIQLNCNAEDYLKTRSKKLKQNTKYYRKKATKIGEIKLVQICDKEGLEKVAELFLSFSISSRNNRTSSSYSDKRMSLFIKNIVNVFGKNSRVDAHILYFGEKISAVSIGWRYGNGYKYILPSYNSEFEKISPGYTLIYELINFAFKNGDSYFDMFAGGHVFYKAKWCNDFPKIFKVKLFKNSCLGLMAFKAYELEKLIKKLKRA